jgi:tryptophanyl-tRNA synthetase
VAKIFCKAYNKFTTMTKERIVSGIRATGKLHVGNYLGALKQFVDLQEAGSHECFFFIADLHALTTPFEPRELSKNTMEVAAEYLAAGLNPDKSIFFLQNHVHEHAELAWIFQCLTPLGELERMTQFKDKSKQHKEAINGGLLTYPTLMAADILIYKPAAVPVGDDQVQHIELTRDIAKKFNNRFGQTFPVPKTYEKKPVRIMSLTDPAKKMSKTGDEALMLDDTPEEIMRKLKKAVTATDISKGSPGVENLKSLLEQFGGSNEVKDFTKYNELKETLAHIIADHFAEFRQKKAELMQNPGKIKEILMEGASKASKIAAHTLTEVKTRIGLL